MVQKAKYVVIAIVVNTLDIFVACRYGVEVWHAYADFLVIRLLLLLFVAVWITSLADL